MMLICGVTVICGAMVICGVMDDLWGYGDLWGDGRRWCSLCSSFLKEVCRCIVSCRQTMDAEGLCTGGRPPSSGHRGSAPG